MKSSPVDRLVSAGLCNASDLSTKDREVLDTLTDDEVDVLVRLQDKLGTAENDTARPNFPL